jgi:hypothetical protein
MSATDTTPRLIGDVLGKIGRDMAGLSPQDTDRLAAVHGLAAEFAGLTPQRRNAFLVEVRRLTSGYDRFRVMTLTPPKHPLFGSLMALFDALIATDDRVVRTTRGFFDRSELVSASSSSVVGLTIHPFRAIRPEEVKRPASMWGDDE